MLPTAVMRSSARTLTLTATATATGAVKGINGLCLANQNALNTAGNPIVVSTCNGGAGQRWSTFSDNTLRVQGGCLNVSRSWKWMPDPVGASKARSATTAGLTLK